VLENYTVGSELTVETYPTTGGTVDVAALRDRADESAVLVHAESPTVRGAIEESLSAVGDVAAAHDALFCLGTDPVAMALLESPASVGADVVVGDAGTLGLGAANGMGHGIFATREAFRRQVPGRLVGAGEDASGRRAYTLTLQTREQHIRRERATSNICTNQAWLALRSAIHVAVLGPEGLLDIARTSVKRARSLAKRIDGIDGVRAPIHDRHYFREFPVRTDQPAPAIREDLLERGFAVHALGEHTLQVCVTDTTEAETGRFVTALREVA
jgi:glycine dehydrogenase subunit 1